MPEEVKADFEKEVANEDAQLKAELDRIKRESQPPPPEEAAAAEPIPPVETPAAEPAATPPAEPAPKPAEAKPQQQDGAAWRLLKQREKELAAERQEKERLAEQLAARRTPTAEPDFENQPADYLKNQLEKTQADIAAERQERQRIQQELQRREYLDTINRQEQEYSKTHPDYWDATRYLIDNDVKEWERTGASIVQTNQVLSAARSTDPRYAPYRDNVRRLASDPNVIAFAEKEGRDPEEVGAYVVARDSWLSQRRDLIAEGARATGRSTAEIAYEIAKERGFGRTAAEDKTAQEAAARARVAQAKEVAAATHSLSDSATAEASPEVRVLKNRQQVLDLDDDSLDSLIASGKYKQL